MGANRKSHKLHIIYEPKFVKNFTAIWDYISIDSRTRANKYKIELKKKIENLVNMPYKFRKSIYFDDKNIRDLIFKGYVIPYKIDWAKNTIFVIGIKKYQDKI
jgi:plasmid stabilization system protein ParE